VAGSEDSAVKIDEAKVGNKEVSEDDVSCLGGRHSTPDADHSGR
jgi:hypothetical protein